MHPDFRDAEMWKKWVKICAVWHTGAWTQCMQMHTHVPFIHSLGSRNIYIFETLIFNLHKNTELLSDYKQMTHTLHFSKIWLCLPSGQSPRVRMRSFTLISQRNKLSYLLPSSAFPSQSRHYTPSVWQIQCMSIVRRVKGREPKSIEIYQPSPLNTCY